MNALTDLSAAIPADAGAADPLLGPDAELILACQDYMNLERQWLRLCLVQGRSEADMPALAGAMDALSEQQRPLVDRICALRPATHAGAVVLARALSLRDQDIFRKAGPGHCTNDRLLAALVAGLIWKRPLTPGKPTAEADDAALAEVCATFVACDRQQRAIYDGPDAVGDEEAARLTKPIFLRMDWLLAVMEGWQARTSVGVAAKAAALAQHSGEFAFSFDERSTMSGRLLATVMRDAAALGTAHAAAPLPQVDAELAVMGQEAIGLIEQYDTAVAAWRALPKGHPDFNKAADVADAPANRLDAFFERADTMQPATLAGLAGKARLLQHQMRGQHTIGGEFCSDGDITTFAWNMLADVLRMAEGPQP